MSYDLQKINLNLHLLIATEENQQEAVTTLLQKGADVNFKGLFGRNALQVASKNGHKNIVKILLSYNVDIDIVDDFGRTSLYSACEFGTFEVIEILLDSGADTNIKANNQTSPLHIATSRDIGEHIVVCLLAHGAKLNTVDSYKKNPLHWACQLGNHNIVRLLLENGTNYSALDEEYATPYDVAVRHRRHEISDFIKRFEVGQLKSKSDVSTQTESSSFCALSGTLDSDFFKDLKLNLVSLTEDVEELEEQLKLLELDKLKLVKNRDILKPRLEVAGNFCNLKSNDEKEMTKWSAKKEDLTAELNKVISEESKLIGKIRTLELQLKVLKIERVQVFLKLDDIVALKLSDLK